MIELLFSALLQIALLSDPSTEQAPLTAESQTTVIESAPTATEPTSESDPNYGGGTTWDDNN